MLSELSTESLNSLICCHKCCYYYSWTVSAVAETQSRHLICVKLYDDCSHAFTVDSSESDHTANDLSLAVG